MGRMSSFQGVAANPVTFSTFTHTCSCSVTTNRLASFIVSHREIHSLFRDAHTTDHFCPFTPATSALSRGNCRFTLSFIVTSTMFCSFVFFWIAFSRFPFGWSLTCHCYLGLLPRGSWGSWTRNTGTNRGRESGDEGHCLGFICVTSPSFTRSYKCPSIPSPM